MTMKLRFPALALLLITLAAADTGPGYHVLKSVVLGGTDGWDYVALDSMHHRLFVARQTRVMVLDPASGKLLGEVTGLNGAHGTAFAYAVNRGFATSGRDSTVTMFNLDTYEVLGRLKADEDADAVLYDPATKRIYTMNGDAETSTVIDPVAGKVVGTIRLGGKPEFAVSAGDGILYANLEDKADIVEIDAKAQKVVREWPMAPCTSPTGLAIDRQHHRLFSGCRNRVMAISDTHQGRLLATVPIGAGVDANAYDPGIGFAFSSNGEGTLTVVREEAPGQFTVAETVPTMTGARTMALDPTTHALYLVGAKFGPLPDSASGTGRRRPPVLPNSFTLLVVGR
jgi:DNA-binding beta-propeller fold protein YncE